MKDHIYKRVPNTPEKLNSVGEDFWKLYCSVFIEREDLRKSYLSAIESLCYWEQQRAGIENSICEHGFLNIYGEDEDEKIVQSNGMQKLLKEATKVIRDLKKDLKLNPDSRKNKSPDPKKKVEKKENNSPLRSVKNW